MTEPTAYPPVEQAPVCPRHPDRVAYVRCQRCNRPTCPECQRPAAVGIQCVDCVRKQSATVRTGTTVFGGRVTDGRPQVTMAIMVVCVIVWVGEQISPEVFQQVAFAPYLGESQPWRFLTSAFAHSPTQITHILFNMYALWIVGRYLEPLLGRARFLVLYLISAVGGSVVYLLMTSPPTTVEAVPGNSWYTAVVGASGAVFGLFGALLVLNRRLGLSSAFIWVIIGINAVLGFVVPGIAWQAHLGGFLTGVLCAAIIAHAGRPGARQIHWAGMAGVSALLVVLAVLKYALI